MGAIPGWDLDREKMIGLLQKYYKRQLTRDEAAELIPLIQYEWERALRRGKTQYAEELSDLLIALNGYAHGSINLVENVSIGGSLDAKKISGG
jgi:hypothetical protein